MELSVKIRIALDSKTNGIIIIRIDMEMVIAERNGIIVVIKREIIIDGI